MKTKNVLPLSQNNYNSRVWNLSHKKILLWPIYQKTRQCPDTSIHTCTPKNKIVTKDKRCIFVISHLACVPGLRIAFILEWREIPLLQTAGTDSDREGSGQMHRAKASRKLRNMLGAKAYVDCGIPIQSKPFILLYSVLLQYSISGFTCVCFCCD
jgi:hypothetical protein